MYTDYMYTDYMYKDYMMTHVIGARRMHRHIEQHLSVLIKRADYLVHSETLPFCVCRFCNTALAARATAHG